MKERDHLVVSALLHDLGKLAQEPSWNLNPWESWLTHLLGPVDHQNHCLQLVTHYRDPQTPLQKLLAHAVEIASDAKTSQAQNRLRSLFTCLRLDENHHDYLYKLEPLRFNTELQQIRKTLFPFANLSKESSSHYVALFQEFQTEWQALLQDDTASIHSFLPRLLSLLERYTWCVPAQVDISLYDHSLVTAACAQALYHYHQPTGFPEYYEPQLPKFLLIGAHLSGIQSYLFHWTLPAENLRARSFYLQQMMASAVRKLLQKLQLLPVAKIMEAGGQAWLLAPNTPWVREILHQSQIEMETWLYEHFFGELAISFVAVEASAKELMEQALTPLDNLQRELQESQLHQFAKVGHHQHWQMSKNHWQQLESEENGRRDHLAAFANELTKSKGFKYTHQNANCHFFEDQGLQLVTSRPASGEEVIYWFTEELKPPLGTLLAKEGVRYFSAHYVPNEMISFAEIAQRGVTRDKVRSAPYLGLLKADIDDFTWLFHAGWETMPKLSQVVGVSRMLELFFGGLLPELLREKFPDVYIVYAGGDDLFLIGPWRDIISVTLRIDQLFGKWCCKNPHLSLSAGIAIINCNYPIYHGAQLAQAALQKSKARTNAQGNIIKNAVTVFDTTVEWSELEKLLSKQGPAERLNAYLRDEHSPLTTRMIQRLLKYHEMWRSLQENGKIHGALWKSKLYYDVTRHLVEKGHRELRKEGAFILEHLMTDEAMKTVRIPLCYALYRNHASPKL